MPKGHWAWYNAIKAKEAGPLEDCLFCKIAAGTITANKVYEDEELIAFTDISPKAPVHVLIVPKEHIKDMLDGRAKEYAAKMFVAAGKIAHTMGIAEDGFRAVLNTGKNGGQTVLHLHMHLLGGRALTWPPG
jgi:histidine triad (HIT) family protein